MAHRRKLDKDSAGVLQFVTLQSINGRGGMTNQEELEARIAELLKKRPAALAEYELAWDLYCGQDRDSDDDPVLSKEADRTSKNLHGLDHAVASYQTQIQRMNHPAEIERKNQTRTRLENLMASKTKKQTAREQGVPEIYLAENGNYRPGMDARHKSDLISAILEAEGEKPNPKAIHRFTLEEALHFIKIRGWQSHVDKARVAVKNKAAKAQTKAAGAKAKATRRRGTAKPKETSPDDEVRPDPKPEAKPRNGRRRQVGS